MNRNYEMLKIYRIYSERGVILIHEE